MCLLTYYPAGIAPDMSALEAGAYANPDGYGFAIVDGDALIVRHSMVAHHALKEFEALRLLHIDGPAMFHSRLGTAGTNNINNCHPIYVGGDRRTVIAHNGVLPSCVQPAHGDTRSDTRIAAETFIPSLGPLSHAKTRKTLERWMGPHNKMVILSVDNRFRKPAYILNEEFGIWTKGAWYSNMNWSIADRPESDLTDPYAPSEHWRCPECEEPLAWCMCTRQLI